MSNSLSPNKAIARIGKDVPRWPAAVALVLIGLTYLLLPQELILGPRWLVLFVGLATLVSYPLLRRHIHPTMMRALSLGTIGLVTITIVVSAIFLVSQLQSGSTPAPTLLRDASLIWCANVVTFAVWYWEIDGGGPAKRRVDQHRSDDFLFPQMSLDDEASKRWSPAFIDYLFLAFNTSTAFSPTDTMVLSRQAKLLMMAQSLISLVVIAVLAARAVNAL